MKSKKCLCIDKLPKRYYLETLISSHLIPYRPGHCGSSTLQQSQDRGARTLPETSTCFLPVCLNEWSGYKKITPYKGVQLLIFSKEHIGDCHRNQPANKSRRSPTFLSVTVICYGVSPVELWGLFKSKPDSLF